MKTLTPNLIKLVHILRDGEFHAGSDIGKQLAITRSAVWKFVNQLQGYGIVVDAVKGKGYRLSDPLVLLNTEAIFQQLSPTLRATVDIDIFSNLNSTNTYLLKKPINTTTQAADYSHQLAVCLAEKMSAGKGRLQRTWHAPFAANIYFSCRKTFHRDISTLNGLSLMVSIATVHTLEKFGLQQLQIKWPNDILYQDKKLAGSLIEISAESHGLCDIVIGIGINVNMLSADEMEINQPWTSMAKILGGYHDRNKIISQLLTELSADLIQFDQLGFAKFIEDWRQYDYLYGKHIELITQNHRVGGVAKGINQQGHILLQDENNEIHSFSSGDARVAKCKLYEPE